MANRDPNLPAAFSMLDKKKWRPPADGCVLEMVASFFYA